MDSVHARGGTTIECYRSRRKLLGLLLLTAAMVGMFAFLASQPDVLSKVIGWIGMVFFSLGFIAFPFMYSQTLPQVVVNDDGIYDRRTKLGVIPWDDIRSVSIRSVNSAKFLCVYLVDPEKYVSRLPAFAQSLTRASEKMGFSALTISFAGLTPGLNEVWEFVHERKPDANLEPRSRYVVTLSDTDVVCQRPDGALERVSWADLQKVEIVTTSEGPLVPDVFWVLQGADNGCAVPQGATGHNELMKRLQELPGFDNGAVIEAMTCTTDRRFLCWQKRE